jgi:hypothetical protein
MTSFDWRSFARCLLYNLSYFPAFFFDLFDLEFVVYLLIHKERSKKLLLSNIQTQNQKQFIFPYKIQIQNATIELVKQLHSKYSFISDLLILLKAIF